jgi:hypothetical protein
VRALTKTTFIIAGATWLGIVVLMQAVYIVRAGLVAPFFISNVGIPRLPVKLRLLYGAIGIVIAGVLLVIAAPADIEETNPIQKLRRLVCSNGGTAG